MGKEKIRNVKKAVLFDLDDTLYDYEKAHNIALKSVHKNLNERFHLSFRKFKEIYDISKIEIKRELSGSAACYNRVLYFQRVIEKIHGSVHPDFTLKLYSAYWDTLLKNIKLDSGVLDVLKKLRRDGLKIGIVSDMTTHIQLRKLKKLGIGKYIDVLVTSEEAGSEKPHAVMFLLALNKLNVSWDEAIFVGDNSVADIEGANAVRMDSVLIKKGPHARLDVEDYRKPNFTINKIVELLDILK